MVRSFITVRPMDTRPRQSTTTAVAPQEQRGNLIEQQVWALSLVLVLVLIISLTGSGYV
jgi:hypothetical protein